MRSDVVRDRMGGPQMHGDVGETKWVVVETKWVSRKCAAMSVRQMGVP